MRMAVAPIAAMTIAVMTLPAVRFMRMHSIARLFNDRDAGLAGKIAGIYGVLIAANVLAWIWALIAFRDYPVLIGTAFLAYTFGLRHAVDADHIAAIDNVTRKLMQEGKRPVAVGLFFSLGHSTIVVVGFGGDRIRQRPRSKAASTAFKIVGGVVGTSVSVIFLFLVAAANFIILCSVYRTFQRVRRGGVYVEEDVDHLLAQRGLLGRLFRPIFRFVSRSWHMYPLGILFGLGFDTATEVGLLGISAAEASKGLPIWSIMVFSALFTAAHVADRHHRRRADARRLWLGASPSRCASSITISPSRSFRCWSRS